MVRASNSTHEAWIQIVRELLGGEGKDEARLAGVGVTNQDHLETPLLPCQHQHLSRRIMLGFGEVLQGYALLQLAREEINDETKLVSFLFLV